MKKEINFVRRWLLFFIAALFISGATAIPLEWELGILRQVFPNGNAGRWFAAVHDALVYNGTHFPFMNYGYDWLAFAHFVLAILFIGPYMHPVRNKWVIEFGMIACVLIIPFAMIAGHFRGISLEWRLIDCSFGIIGIIPLYLIRKKILQMEAGDFFTRILPGKKKHPVITLRILQPELN